MKVRAFYMKKFFGTTYYVVSRLLVIYFIVATAMYFLQDSMIYKPDKSLKLQQYQLPQPWQTVTLNTSDELQLTSWYLPAETGEKTILYLHGNGGDIANRVGLAKLFKQYGYGMFLLEYRGYADNPGKPSETGLYQDSLAAYQWLIEQGVNPENIIVYGESLGAALAIRLAAEQPVGGLILDTPFYSMLAMANSLYPFLPNELLLKDKYESYRYAPEVTVPTIIFYGMEDEMIPLRQVTNLYSLIKSDNKLLVLIPGQLHNYKDMNLIVNMVALQDALTKDL